MSHSRVIVVTGSSSGIGKAIAIASASQATHLILHGRSNLEGLQDTARLLGEKGIYVRAFLYDLSLVDNHRRLVDAAFTWQGRVDGWVNAAGADVLTGECRKASFEEKLKLLWETDVLSTISISRLAAARMSQQIENHGSIPSIINIGWDQAEAGMEGDSGQYFSATKGAIMAFSRSLAKSVGPRVRVNCIAPGWIRTSWGESAPSHWDERARGESCMARWGTPEDVAYATTMLLSPSASFLNGQTIQVNGGWKPK